MSRGPPKKRTSIFLDDSGSESSSCSCKDNSTSGDESFHADDDDSDNISTASYNASADPLICTQPVRPSILKSTPDKSILIEASRGSRDTSSSVMDSLAMVPDDATQTHAMTITPKAPPNPLISNANIVTNQKSSKFTDVEEIEVLDPAQVSKKPSKLRLKVRMKSRTSDPSSKQNENEQISGRSQVLDERISAIAKEPSWKESTSDQNDKRVSVVHELVDSRDVVVVDDVDDDEVTVIKKTEAKTSSPVKSTATPKSKTQRKAPSPAKSASTPSTGVKRKRKVAKDHKVESSSDKSLQKSTPAPAQKSAANSTASSSSTAQTPKPKKKKSFQNQVLLHMMTTMKPFNLKGLASDLRTTDIALQNLMLSLLDKGVVRRKEFGKNKKELYWVDLEKATKEIFKEHVPTTEDMRKAKSELNTILGEENVLMEVLKGMESEFTNEDLAKQLEDEEKIVRELRTRMQQAKDRIADKTDAPQGGSDPSRFAKFRAPPKKPKTRKQQNTLFNKMRGEWKSRKEKCSDFVDNLSDAMEKRPKEVIKMLEFGTDEMLGVKIPPKRNLDD